MKQKRLVFLTGTRADFGKIKSLLKVLRDDADFDVHVFVTGMHMLRKYGYTCAEVEKEGIPNIYKYINQNHSDTMDAVLAKTIGGFSDYIKETQPDMIVVHGDRVEALAGAIVGSLNNILVSHIEGGEVSGTIDELIRHSVSKLSHLHFVANEDARRRMIQLGEKASSIFVIGSPDLDIMSSPNLPSIEKVRERYEIKFNEYAILLFHPVTTEVDDIKAQTQEVVDAVIESGHNYIVIYPNNDNGSEYILDVYEQLKDKPNFQIFPSMRFEYFLTTMKHSQFVVGNSSAGIREAPYFSVPCVNIGSRQNQRSLSDAVTNCAPDKEEILKSINVVLGKKISHSKEFGDGQSAEHFHQILKEGSTWGENRQKYFVDLEE